MPLHVILTAEGRDHLEQRLRCTTTSLGLARWCQANLGVADGLPLVEVARLVDLNKKHVRKWVQRSLKDHLDGLRDRPGRGRAVNHGPGLIPERLGVGLLAVQQPSEGVTGWRLARLGLYTGGLRASEGVGASDQEVDVVSIIAFTDGGLRNGNGEGDIMRPAA